MAAGKHSLVLASVIILSSVQSALPGAPLSDEAGDQCRVRGGMYTPDNFIRTSCALCYQFLFPHVRHVRFWQGKLIQLNDQLNGTAIVATVAPHPSNETSMTWVCSTLGDADKCTRWRHCCRDAVTCCDTQQTTIAVAAEGGHCARTWDGFSCVRDTAAGNDVKIPCPPFMENAVSGGSAVKTCTENGTWFTKGEPEQEWTDYTPCTDKQGHLTGVYICLACNGVSLLLLLPAVAILLAFRDLRRQHRVRVHVHFFISLALNCVANILWYVLVHYDALVSPVQTQSVIYTNPAWCRLLSYMKLYLTSSSYFWMFCEGYYLHRLITNAFQPPSTLLLLYGIGWGLPVLPSVTYAVIRGLRANERCWVYNYGAAQWIFYAPNLFCLAVNMIFLCNILRILLFRLHSHPHEPNNFRRGLKAAFMLVPLFGLQLFLTIYRPAPGTAGERQYEHATFVITNSQGIFVSLIFCFFNSEVLANMQAVCICCRESSRARRARHSAQFTQITSIDDRERVGKSPSISLRSRDAYSCSPENNGSGDPTELCEYPTSHVPSNGSLQPTPGYTSLSTESENVM